MIRRIQVPASVGRNQATGTSEHGLASKVTHAKFDVNDKPVAV